MDGFNEALDFRGILHPFPALESGILARVQWREDAPQRDLAQVSMRDRAYRSGVLLIAHRAVGSGRLLLEPCKCVAKKLVLHDWVTRSKSERQECVKAGVDTEQSEETSDQHVVLEEGSQIELLFERGG